MDIEGVFPQNKLDVAKQASIKINTELHKIGGVDVKILCRADIGQDMGLLNHVRKVEDNSSLSINHETNEVLLLCFWASWCKFSKEPMAGIQKMIDEKSKKWGDKVRVLALSIDQDW